MGLSGRRLTLILATLLGVLLVVGAAAAFAVGRSQRLAAQTTTTSSADASLPTGGPSSSGDAGSGSTAASRQSRQPTVDPAKPSRTEPIEGTGISEPQADPEPSRSTRQPVSVTMSARAAASPYAEQVSGLLMRYFTAINRHDYDAWLATVSTGQAKQDRDRWIKGYSTTHDSHVYISDIVQQSDALLVRMQFVSHQSVELAPTALPLPCVSWDVTYRILDEGPGLRVGTSAEAPSMAPCS